MSSVGKLVKYRRILSGTPVLNGYHDLWAQYNFLIGPTPEVPDIWRKWRRFAEDHLVFSPIFPGKVEAVRGLPVIRRQLAPFTFHIRAEDVLDLPPETDLIRTCSLGRYARKVYDQVERDLFAEFDEHTITTPNALVKLLRLAEITGGFVHGVSDKTGEPVTLQVDRAKLGLLREVIEELDAGEKFVVFCRFTAERRAIQTLLNEMCIDNVSLHGEQSTELRARELADFTTHRDVRALVTMLQAGSTAVDLSAARYALYFSVGFGAGDYFQSRGRIRRHGQTRPQFYSHLLAEKSIDEYVHHALRRKESISDAVRAWWGAQRGG